MKKVKAFKYFFTALLLGALSFSCDIGLGEAVDLTAPQVTIAAPAVSQSVAKEFVITGQASDDIGLRSITVDIEGTGYTEKFQWASNSWKKLSNGAWVDYKAAKSTGTPNSVLFSIPVNASRAQSGHEYTITTKVTDLSGNEGAKSKDERSIIIDTTEPVVSIIEPVRLMAADDSEFDDYVLQNNSVLPKIKNRKFTISGSQKEDTKLDYLVVYLDTETDVITLGSVTEYPVANPLVKKVITGSNLRNWSTEVSDTEFSDQNICTGTHILRLVTESHDQAGNIEIKSHGWFKFDNGADIPWVVAAFGQDNLSDSKIPANSTYPRCSLQGQAYDDDGLKSISIKVYEEDGETLIQDCSVKAATLAAEGNPTYKAWSFNALSETKSCVVKVSCTDVNGVTSDEVVRYLTISDVNPPNISNLSPANGTSVLGNASGKFTFSGQVDDDGSIKFVKIVRIKNDTDQMNYFDKDYEGWTNCTSTTAPYVDGNGNKVWMLSLSNETTNAQNRKVCTWSKEFNIFTDFGINGTTELLTNQKFIILAQDAGDSANIEAYTLQGDIDPPEISIEYIYVKDSVNTTPYEWKDEPIELRKPFNRDSSTQRISDKIKLSGTWEDNSTTNWSDKTKHGELVLKVSDKQVSVTVNNNGTWETGFFTPTDSSVSVITAEMKDWAGNKANASRSYYVNSSTPVLSRIGAETADGAYNAGKTIEITMEFNKAITFEEGTADPYLVLNAGPTGNKRTAVYDSGNKTSKHVYKYTVMAGDDPVDASGKAVNLNVTGIVTNGHKWHDEAMAYISPLTIPSTGGTSLGGGRSITIDTQAPKLESFSVISGSGWNKANSSIFIQAKFSEDITITPEDLSTFQLEFSNGATTDSATKTGPRTVLFKYVVNSGDTYTDRLQIASVKSSGYTISDIAGNNLQSITTLPNNLPTAANTVIKIDTVAPAIPQIKNLPGNATVYADNFKFTIDGWEENASEKKYTLDGSTWLNYAGEVTVSANGNYSISAYQTDAAGNRSSYATPVSRTLNKNLIISSITAEESDGTYTTGDVINIKLVCNENLVVDEANAYLLLNATTETPAEGKSKAYYLSGSGTKELKFKYTIAEGDSCSAGLTVEDFVSGIKTDTSDPAINFANRCALPEDNNLADNRTINVVTGVPTVSGVTVDQTGTNPVIKIVFSKKVSKKVGGIIRISQDYEVGGKVVYRAPAVLTPSQYNNFKAVTGDIDDYYDSGVNGVLYSGNTPTENPDLSEKYVLKFDYHGQTQAVQEFFRDTIIDSDNNGTILDVFVSTSSGKVKMDSDGKTMLVTLSDNYKLPVKGAGYTITIPSDIAVDEQGHVNQNLTGKTYAYQTTFTMSGTERPVIRVKKGDTTVDSEVAKQPATADVKMDCQTPDSTVKYKIKTYKYSTVTISESSIKNSSTIIGPGTPTETTSAEVTLNTAGTSITIGDSNDKSSGLKLRVMAYTSSTNEAWEMAYRSVIRLGAGTPNPGGDTGGFTKVNGLSNVYVRGGDSDVGEPATLGFPLSWNGSDYGRVKLMTNENSYWYYISWNISVNCYFGFLAGNAGTNDEDTMSNGPLNWCWASCSWVGNKKQYPLRPGTSFTLTTYENDNTIGKGGYAYQVKHQEYRKEATVKQGILK